MERITKFRGKAAESGRWIYGDLIENQGDFHIYHATSETTLPWDRDTQIAVCAEKVDFKTVGQFTGLHDKDGKEIYEGDIINNMFSDKSFICRWIPHYVCFAFVENIKYGNDYYFQKADECRLTIVGNIHDTPELLKGGEK